MTACAGKSNIMVSVVVLEAALRNIETMPQWTFFGIMVKSVEINIAPPLCEGNERSTPIWFDLILKKELRLKDNRRLEYRNGRRQRDNFMDVGLRLNKIFYIPGFPVTDPLDTML